MGTDESIATAAGVARPGAVIGAVGFPTYEHFDYKTLFWKNVGIRSGVAPARPYIPELLEPVLDGRIDPDCIFDFRANLDQVAEAYAAMDERRAIKSLLLRKCQRILAAISPIPFGSSYALPAWHEEPGSVPLLERRS